ncbi:MAG: NUDIX hydrolase [Sorangiineae bacterium]|nr:NUDIX hydrolase [Sorangiineae bacterium]MEB2343339.1 NUDIX hydrolase [Deltaproteobacteria bacterium]
MERWRVLDSRVILERPWLRVREERIALPSGVELDEFHVVEGVDWVGVLALTAEGDAVLVEQYRHGLGGTSRELPAGVIDPGESPLGAAQRELREETGFAAADWAPLLTVHTEPSRHTSRAHFYVARGARPVGPPAPEAAEEIAVLVQPAALLLDDIASGRIQHGVHVGAILLAARRGLF